MIRPHALAGSSRRRPNRPRLETLERRALLTTITVSTAADAGVGSLRDAITQVNSAASSSVTTIDFSIGTGGLQTIALQSALPKISFPVAIDGTSQPGAATTPRIELNGSAAGGGIVGLDLAGGASSVRGLVVDGFASGTGASPLVGVGIELEGVETGDSVTGSFIGTDPTGTKASPNGVGILVTDVFNGRSALIGGTTAADRNVISGNGTGVSASGGTIEGNYVGTDVTGTVAVPNNTGLLIDSSLYGTPPAGSVQGTIGGATSGAGNVVSGNNGDGIVFAYGMNWLTQGNTIGLGADGKALGNGADGIAFFAESLQRPGVEDVSYNDPVGGLGAGQGNIIAENRGVGVNLLPGAGIFSANPISIAIRGSAIYDNGGFGIDLGNDRVSANQLPGDTRTGGPNSWQQFPLLTSVSASSSTGMTTLAGTLDSTPSTSFLVDFYASAAADPSGFGQGQRYLATASVVTDASGHAAFSTSFATPAGLPFFTATATNPLNSTSEFSQAVSTTTVATRADLAVSSSSASQSVIPSQTVTLTHTLTNNGPDTAIGAVLVISLVLNDSPFTLQSILINGVDFTAAALADEGRFAYGTLPSGVSQTVLATYGAAAGSSSGSTGPVTVSDNLSVYSASGDTNLTNNITSGSFTLLPSPAAQLAVATAVSPASPLPSSAATITVTVTNTGNAGASNLVVNDTPSGTVTSFRSSAGSIFLQSGQIVASIGSLAAGASATITINLTTPATGTLTNTGSLTSATTSAFTGQFALSIPARPRDVRSDFDGDGISDIAEYLPTLGAFAIRPSSGAADEIIPFGIAGTGQSIAATGDYDGDGKTDLAVYLPALGEFAVRPSSGGADQITPFGIPGAGQSIPVPGDYDGDGKTDLAVYFPAYGAFAYRPSSGGADQIIQFGIAGVGNSIPAPGDYDGDGKTDLAVYLPSLGDYAVRPSSGGADRITPFGASGAGQSIPAPGDYDGDGRTDLAVYLPAYGYYAYRPSSGGADQLIPFGQTGAGQTLPAPGDYDGDGKTDVAADLPAFGLFAVRPSSGGVDRLGSFGPAGLGSSVPVSGLASLATPDSGVQAASVATVSAESVPTTPIVSTVTPASGRRKVVSSAVPAGPTRQKLSPVAQADRRHHDLAADEG